MRQMHLFHPIVARNPRCKHTLESSENPFWHLIRRPRLKYLILGNC